MTNHITHRLSGLEPDNLLAFMALLGLMRALEEARPDWHSRISWTINDLPLRPALQVPKAINQVAVIDGVREGLNRLAACHEFHGVKNLALSPEYASDRLRQVSVNSGESCYTVDLWSALFSDAVMDRDGKKVEPTPLCLMLGQGHQYFLERLALVPQQPIPPDRGTGRGKIGVSETECLREALFLPWARLDKTLSFRWDPEEDVRYALRARNPNDPKTKETTQHGANRLAAIGLSVLTVVPRLQSGRPRLKILGGHWKRGTFLFEWPIWEQPTSLAGICALLGHPHLNQSEIREMFGIVERRRARRINFGRYKNFTRANSIIERD